MHLIGNFTATGIGSLPYQAPEPALDLISKTFVHLPHWPQLPKRSSQEHFVFQSLAPLVRLELIEAKAGGTPVFTDDSQSWADNLTAFYSLYLEAEGGDEQALEEFAIPQEAGAGFYAFLAELEQKGYGQARALKGQVAGPVTAGLYINSASGRSSFYDPQLRDLLVKSTALQARWQARVLGRLGLPAVIFVDEPALSAYGTSTHIALQREDLIEALAGVVEGIVAGGGLPGAHSCSGMEWPILLEAGYRILSFDAYNYFTSLQVYAAELAGFLEQGGILAWGIVPTSEEAWQETAASLMENLIAKITELEQRGLSREMLYRQAWLTPACGTGVLAVELAEHIYRLTAELSLLLKNRDGAVPPAAQ